ncbi:MAG: hypothetical protein ACKOCM_06905 [Cyanobacteriota bacterium]
MSVDHLSAGPLAAAEAARLEQAPLSAAEHLQLRLLAHSLRTLQLIAGRRRGPAPSAREIVAWAHTQAPLAEDDGFRAAFCQQLLTSADLLATIASSLPPEASLPEASPPEAPGPLALELEQLVSWCEHQGGKPPGRLPASPSSPQPPAAP